jgi:ABC-type dipeptide/oligopeptide/nickel transport system ATPase subunit
MKKLEELTLENISVRCKPFTFNIDAIPDELNLFSYTFKEGHVYGIISQPGSGAWALSYLLAGRVKKYLGTIRINGEKANSQLLTSNSIYIGEELNSKRWLFGVSEKTIREQLEELKKEESLQNRRLHMSSILKVIEKLKLNVLNVEDVPESFSSDEYKLTLASGENVFVKIPFNKDKLFREFQMLETLKGIIPVPKVLDTSGLELKRKHVR